MTIKLQRELAQFAKTEFAEIVSRHFDIPETIVPELMIELAPFVFNGIKAHMCPSDGLEYMEYLLSQFYYLASSRAIAMDECALQLFGETDHSREWLIHLISKKYQIPLATVERLLPTFVTFILNFLAKKQDEIGIMGVYLLLEDETKFIQSQTKYPLFRRIHSTKSPKCDSPRSIINFFTRSKKK